MVAVIYDKRFIEGIGIAAIKTHPLQKQFGKWPYLHAETDAITSAMRHVTSPNRRFKLAGCSIYIHRIRTNGTIGIAKPCINCQQILSIFGITDIRWSIG